MDEIDAATHPIGFAETVLGLSLYSWQDRALAPLELATGRDARRVKITLRTPNGAGKSERVVAAAALWWVSAHKRGKVVITSKDSKQLLNQVVPAIDGHIAKFQDWDRVRSPYYRVTTPTGGAVHAFVTDEASRVEGWHKDGDSDGPLLIIVDEAKSIPDEIFQAIDRCTWNALLLASSPGIKRGRFFESHTSLRGDYIAVSAGLADCPHIPAAKVEDIVRTYGEDHPFTRSTIYGEFMDQADEERFCLPLSALLNCLDNPPYHRAGEVVAFCDFAEGGDENVIALRNGNAVSIPAAWRESNKHAAVGRFIREFVQIGLKPQEIWCDASDSEMANQLRDAGWPINRINFGSRANNDELYVSWAAEAWLEGAAAIERCAYILPDDEVLKAQMTSRHRGINARGKLTIEDKYSLRKRNIKSPDRADAVFGAIACHPVREHNITLQRPEAWIDEMRGEITGGALVGADAGW